MAEGRSNTTKPTQESSSSSSSGAHIRGAATRSQRPPRGDQEEAPGAAPKPLLPPTGYLGRCRSVEVYEKLNRLGQGTYGTVYRARNTESGEIVALKKVRIHDAKGGFPQSALREIRLLKKLRHQNVVELKEVVCGLQPGSVFLVFEYCEHDVGALLDLMERPFSQPEVKCLMLQLLRAIHYLHGSHVMHRDIKLSNLLLTNKGILKLADLGLAREYSEPPQPCTTNVVTLWYRAPELLLGAKKYTPAVDMWAIGCNFGELLSRRPLLPGRAEEHQLQLMCELLGSPTLKIWPGLEELPGFARVRFPATCVYNTLRECFPTEPDGCLDLLNRMLTFDPAKRATAACSLEHRYFSEPPAPQDPQWMPTFREHRNEVPNPRSVGAPSAAAAAPLKRANSSSLSESLRAGGGAKRPVPATAAPALLAAAKRIKSCIF